MDACVLLGLVVEYLLNGLLRASGVARRRLVEGGVQAHALADIVVGGDLLSSLVYLQILIQAALDLLLPARCLAEVALPLAR